MVSPLTPQPPSPKLTPCLRASKRMGTAGSDLSTRGRDKGTVGPLSPQALVASLLPTSRCRPALTKPGPDQMELISN